MCYAGAFTNPSLVAERISAAKPPAAVREFSDGRTRRSTPHPHEIRGVPRCQPRQSEAVHAQGRRPCQGPPDAGNVAAGDRQRRLHRPREAAQAGRQHGPRPAGAGRAGQAPRRQVSQGDAVPQHSAAAGPGLVGRRAAARGAEAGRQGEEHPPRLLPRLSQQRSQAAVPIVARLQPGDGNAAVGPGRRSSPIGSTASRSRWCAAGRCA